MPNAWINHVKAYHAKHPNLSYKEAMSESKKTYKKTNNKQKGNGPYAAEAEAAAQVVGTLGDVSKGAIGAVQSDKAHSGRYDKAKFDKKSREFGRLKRKMKNDKFPQMTDEQLLKYIDANYGNL